MDRFSQAGLLHTLPHAIIINQSSRAKTQKTTKPLRKHTENTGKGNKKKRVKNKLRKKELRILTIIHHPIG